MEETCIDSDGTLKGFEKALDNVNKTLNRIDLNLGLYDIIGTEFPKVQLEIKNKSGFSQEIIIDQCF